MRLSLCMIVRDEAVALRALLPCVVGIVDEVVVVDTGSCDDTVALLEQHGARILHAPWQDDYAAARNVGLGHAVGDWILVLDADERVDAGTIAALREQAATAPTDVFGFVFDIHNYCAESSDLTWQRLSPSEAERYGAPGFHRTQVVRMFRRDPALRYQGRVHELIEPAIAARGSRFVPCGQLIHHQLVERLDAKGRTKSERYCELLRLKIGDDPTSAKAHWEYGQQLLTQGKVPAALDALLRARELAPGNSEIEILLALAYNDANRPLDALRVLASIQNRDPMAIGEVRTLFQLGRAYAHLGQVDRAVTAFSSARLLAPHMPQPVYWLARLSLTHDPARHDRFAQALRRHWPRFVPGAWLECERAIRAGAITEGLERLDELLAAAETDDASAEPVLIDELANFVTRLSDAADALVGEIGTMTWSSDFGARLMTSALYRMAANELAAGDVTAAAALLQSLLRITPGHVEALTDLAGLHGNSGRVETAFALLERAVALAPNNPLVHHNLAIAAALASPPRLADARTHAERARALGHSADPELVARLATTAG
ncbi:MAG: glycosyltransferase [Planctomycetota bacterium]